jgi:hypothetical protein
MLRRLKPAALRAVYSHSRAAARYNWQPPRLSRRATGCHDLRAWIVGRILSECQRAIAEARALSDKVHRARAELAAERRFRREMRRIEGTNRQRFKEAKRASRAEQRSESDEEVRVNIPPELVPLWERKKRSIHGSERMSRTEAFLHWVEEHPDSMLEALEDRTEQVVRDLERREREARRALKRPVPPEAYAEVPF